MELTMIAHALPKRVALVPEQQFAQPPANWTTDGQLFYCLEPSVEGLKQATLENANYRVRVNNPHDDILGLRNGTFSFGRYVAGIPNSAAPGQQCPDGPDRILYQTALGGARRGYAAAFTGEGTPAQPVVDAEHFELLEVDDWIFAFNTAAQRGEFHRIDAKLDGNALQLDRPLAFEPTANDVAKAVLMAYFDQHALTKHDDPGHLTLGLLFRGEEGPDDIYEALGAKLSMTLEAIQPGALVSARFEGQCARFRHEEPELDGVTLEGLPAGNDPVVSSIGDETLVKMATFGQPLADIPILGSLEPKVGITHKPVAGVNGLEGVQGYVGDGWGECGVSFSTYHSKACRQEFVGRVRKHLLLQVGIASQRAIGMYWPSLSYREDPGRGVQTDLTASRLVFRGHERMASSEIGRSSLLFLFAN
ncbi:hypothetical protein PPSIR1_06056 [Plesiocystis pacifica SIR-1]|uniref:Uncharacterized protein n=2 Tax=Plesiocystis pacifica TaxID=191768 RepID=A6G6T6_9BACT|nr:hypothetical protein PPSIR1_06056 [Plesiocystis pacifica SIR-1]